MELQPENSYRDLQALQDKCRRCQYYHTNLTMIDGSTFDGIIENIDGDRIIVLVGEDVMEPENEDDMQRQYSSYGRPRRRRFRRFRRHAFPLSSLAALSLLPYPYFAPPYPYYPY